MMDNVQDGINWTIKQLEGRELQHRTFKRDRDEITLSITEVRRLVDSHGSLQIDLASAQARIAALEAENERLRSTLENVEQRLIRAGKAYEITKQNAIDVYKSIRKGIREALQPAKEVK